MTTTTFQSDENFHDAVILRFNCSIIYYLDRASTNKKMKETVALELSFVNSNLQLLKEQLAELNSSVELYQMQNKSEVKTVGTVLYLLWISFPGGRPNDTSWPEGNQGD